MDTMGQQYHPSQRSKYALSEKPLDLQLDWAAFLNANQSDTEDGIPVTNTSAMAVFLKIPLANLSGPDNITTFQVPNITTSSLNGAIEEAVSMLLGVVIADGIARTASLGTFPWLITNSTPTYDELIPLPIYLRPESTLYGYFKSNVTTYPVQLELDHYGYGYAIRNKATRFAFAMLALYVIIVCLHVIYILVAVITSRYYGGSCWENVGDLIALAVNSPPTHMLYGTSAGVASTGTWKHMVKVRGSGHDHLELIFAGTEHEEVGAIIEVNKQYY